MDGRRMAVAGLILLTAAGVSGCMVIEADAAREASPSASASDTGTTDADTPPGGTISGESTPPPEVEAERLQLPIPSDEIGDWAETAVPDPDTDGWAGAFSGWMSEHSSTHHTSSFRSLEPGVYQGQIACRGEGTIEVSAGDLDAEPSAEPIACANATIAFDITTTATGMDVALALDGDPTVYAVSIRRIS